LLDAELAALLRVRSEHAGSDGSSRLLVQLADGQAVESVLLPRDGLCVSSQVGCAVGCTFCMTGRDGLLRQLGSAEIVAQVVLARRRRKVKPRWSSWAWASRRTTWTTCSTPSNCSARPAASATRTWCSPPSATARVRAPAARPTVKPALALSLHTTRADLRAQLLPKAPRHRSGRTGGTRRRYARATGYPIQYQWTLLEGINDGDDELDGIVRLLKGKYAVMNFIPFNAVDGLDSASLMGARRGDVASTSTATASCQAAPVGRSGHRRRLRGVVRRSG
jgi:23S rRNA (adenine2503-C2)-methyltransferase